MTNHEVKIHPEHFSRIISRKKTFELRKNDRDYKEGDGLVLRCFNPELQDYTGESCKVRITHVLYGKDTVNILDPDYCILSFEYLWKKDGSPASDL